MNVLDRINKIDMIGDDENPDNPVNPVKKDYQHKAICGDKCGFVDCKSGDNNFPWPKVENVANVASVANYQYQFPVGEYGTGDWKLENGIGNIGNTGNIKKSPNLQNSQQRQ